MPRALLLLLNVVLTLSPALLLLLLNEVPPLSPLQLLLYMLKTFGTYATAAAAAKDAAVVIEQSKLHQGY